MAEQQWLSYAEAARRVKSSDRTVRNWRRQGMPMQWRVDESGQRHRVVELEVLLSWWRAKMQASPIHFYKMRAAAIERGETPPPIPEKFRGGGGRPVTPQDHSPTRDSAALQPSGVREYQDGPQSGSDSVLDVLRDLPEFKGHREHAALVAAMDEHPPACDGLDVYTRDRYTDPEEVDMMRGICRACPLLDLCAEFAAAGKPTGGMWAGMTPAEIRQGAISNPTLDAA